MSRATAQRPWIVVCPLLFALWATGCARALTAAETVARQSKWEAEVQAFERSDQTNPPPPNATLFVGSSSIRLWKTLAEDFPDAKVINRGFGGSELRDSTFFADRIICPYRPKCVVLYAGDNDIAAGRTPEQVARDFADFVAKVRAQLPRARIVFVSIKPSLARWSLVEKMRRANQRVEEQCRHDPRLRYADIFTPMLADDGKPKPDIFMPDGLHLNRAGYRLWTEHIRALLQ